MKLLSIEDTKDYLVALSHRTAPYRVFFTLGVFFLTAVMILRDKIMLS